jgi:hypothetical protein
MNRYALTAALVFSGLLAGAAQAAPATVTATLAKAVASETTYVAAGAVWRCADTTCRVTSVGESPNSVTACRALAKKFGELTQFGTADEPMKPERLALCNGGAK